MDDSETISYLHTTVSTLHRHKMKVNPYKYLPDYLCDSDVLGGQRMKLGDKHMLFGDCSADTLNCPSGTVAEGEIIGYTGGDAYSGELGISSGAHCHESYASLYSECPSVRI